MKPLLCLSLAIGTCHLSFAQNIGIGTNTPHPSAALDISSTSKGLLLPRLSAEQKSQIPQPAQGLIVYQTDSQQGLYINTGLPSQPQWTYLGGPVASPSGNGWSLNGNSGTNPAENFVGTTDNRPLLFKVNNVLAGQVQLNTGNVSLGYGALTVPGSGNNSAFGHLALQGNLEGFNNVAIGSQALFNNSLGGANTAVGTNAGQSNVNGTGITVMGYAADVTVPNLTNAMALGTTALVNASNKIRIGNSDVTIIEGQVPYSIPSDGRFKSSVVENVPGIAFIKRLRPVTYLFSTSAYNDFLMGNLFPQAGNIFNPVEYGRRQTGFIAQEVEVAAQAIGYDFSGLTKPQNGKETYSLSYESFVPALVKAIQEQQVLIEQLKQQVDQLAARLK